ncbi:DUF1643 domain-containing protein [Raoultella terrigena]|uniref:DUF1643 domain-containing protein n=1 Tax=Raoultella terrigena TaxID=577 RepID=UPI0021681DDE|nr:DUF1643 domain-containing protein [Raoultella terrigena]
MLKSAVFSDCGLYRYSIARTWDETKPYAVFIGLNPSYADAEHDDPTLGRCISFAQGWGMGLSLIHLSEPTGGTRIPYPVVCFN